MLYQKVFLALSGNEDELNVIKEAMRIVSALQSALTVVHINDPAAGYAHMMMDSLPKITAKDLIDLFSQAGFDAQAEAIEFRLLKDTSYAEAIAAATQEADLLIMGHHAKNMLKALFTDGTDERVADRMHCPVLMVPLN